MVLDGRKITSCLLYYTICIVGLSYCRLITPPSYLLLGSDIFLILLIMILLKTVRNRIVIENSDVTKVFCVICIVILYCFVNGLINMVPISYMLQGARSFLRGLVLLIGITLYFEKKDVYLFFERMEKLFIINMIFAIIQKLKYPAGGDYVIGFTGTHLTLFMSLMQAYAVTMYMKRQKKLSYVLMVTLCNFLIAIWGDQRIFFFMFLVCVLVIIFSEKLSIRSVGIAIGLILSLSAGLYGLYKFAPAAFNTIVDIDSIMEYGNLTDGGYEISRFGAFDTINNLFFHDNIFLKLFGFGFGSAETGTPFNYQYEYLHYMWFMHEWTFIELGYIGIVLFLFMYIYIFYVGRKTLKYAHNDQEYCMMVSSITIAVITAMTTVYYNVHRSYSSIFMYGAMAMMLVLIKEND